MFKALENVKKNMIRGSLRLGTSSCRGCSPICSCNLRQSDSQPNKPLRGVCEKSVSLARCHAGQHGGGVWREEGGTVLTRMLFCGLLGGAPGGSCVMWWRAADPGPVSQRGFNKFGQSVLDTGCQRSFYFTLCFCSSIYFCMFFFKMLLEYLGTGVSNIQPVGHNLPARVFSQARLMN